LSPATREIEVKPNRRGKNRLAFHHWVYVLEDRVSVPFFKVGYTTQTPEERAHQEELRIARDDHTLCDARVVAEWKFKTCDFARAFEELFLYALRRLGYYEFDRVGNWFEIPGPDMTKLVSNFDKMAQAIIANEDHVSMASLIEAVGLRPVISKDVCGRYRVSLEEALGI
jgi:hypothetical protein